MRHATVGTMHACALLTDQWTNEPEVARNSCCAGIHAAAGQHHHDARSHQRRNRTGYRRIGHSTVICARWDQRAVDIEGDQLCFQEPHLICASSRTHSSGDKHKHKIGSDIVTIEQ